MRARPFRCPPTVLARAPRAAASASDISPLSTATSSGAIAQPRPQLHPLVTDGCFRQGRDLRLGASPRYGALDGGVSARRASGSLIEPEMGHSATTTKGGTCERRAALRGKSGAHVNQLQKCNRPFDRLNVRRGTPTLRSSSSSSPLKASCASAFPLPPEQRFATSPENAALPHRRRVLFCTSVRRSQWICRSSRVACCGAPRSPCGCGRPMRSNWRVRDHHDHP